MKILTSLYLLPLNFFAPRLSENNSPEENEKAKEIRLEFYRSILKEQFQLAYFGKIGYGDSDRMSAFERRMVYKILVEQKQEEKKAQDEAFAKSKERKRPRRRMR